MAEQEPKLTPMMQRYMEVKREHPEAILLFRMGDFYELFHEDAQTAARVLGLTLTSRDKGSANPTPMAGFPYHQLDSYLRKLIQSGFRAAVCEQVEDPKLAKGLVKREVTRVVTPGTLTEDSLLDPRENNFLATVILEKERAGIAWLELSTGRFLLTEVDGAVLFDEIARIKPAECLISDGQRDFPGLTNLKQLPGMLVVERPAWSFAREKCRQRLLDQFELRTLEGFDIDESILGVTAAGALLEYVQETQRGTLGHIVRLEAYRRNSTLIIDEATRRSLELTRTLRENKRDGSLLDILDQTVSPMGARLLGETLSNPLTDIAVLNERLDAVEEFSSDAVLCQEIQELLKKTYDLQRLTARIATGRAGPRDLSCLEGTLGILPRLKARIAGRRTELVRRLESTIDLCDDIRGDIAGILVDDPPLAASDGGMIRTGYSAALDELRDLARGGKEWIAKYQATEIERTGIANLKVGFNRVFGYYLEVTAAQADKVPPEYIRKQTLKNQERYITPELKEHEERVLRSEQQSISLEQEIFTALRERVAKHGRRLQTTSEVLAQIDLLVSFAILAMRGNYCRPELLDEAVLEIVDGRHPVLDRILPAGEFVPNDIRLGGESGLIQLITGPNMAGKSTYIRQAALLTILAQMGSFVPARSARIGVADRIFARVGASDELGRGQSTFMVEMTETARILNAATGRSLVILDEIGRGTSTYDGISLAWSVTEYLHDRIGCRTLFATHYHELTELTQTLAQARNWNVAVREEDLNVIFLHKIVEGTADKSYGIHVARLAGIPQDVVDRARTILSTLESDHMDEAGHTRIPERSRSKRPASREKQLSLFESPPHPLLETIKGIDLNQMTPLKALETLHEMQTSLQSGPGKRES